MNDQVCVDINSPLIPVAEKPKQYCTSTFKLLLCTFTILSTIAFLVYCQFNGTKSLSPTISSMSMIAATNDNTEEDMSKALVVPADEEHEEEIVDDVNYSGCMSTGDWRGNCMVGYDNFPGQSNSFYKSCYDVIDRVVGAIFYNWDVAIARVKQLYGISVKTCLKNKLALSGQKTIVCSDDSTCGSSSMCYAKCSSSDVWISKENFWNKLPVVVGGSYDGYYSAPCVAAALTNYLSNFYCLRSDSVAQKIGMGFGQWYRETYSGASLSECPSGCDLS